MPRRARSSPSNWNSFICSIRLLLAPSNPEPRGLQWPRVPVLHLLTLQGKTGKKTPEARKEEQECGEGGKGCSEALHGSGRTDFPSLPCSASPRLREGPKIPKSITQTPSHGCSPTERPQTALWPQTCISGMYQPQPSAAGCGPRAHSI